MQDLPWAHLIENPSDDECASDSSMTVFEGDGPVNAGEGDMINQEMPDPVSIEGMDVPPGLPPCTPAITPTILGIDLPDMSDLDEENVHRPVVVSV